MFEFYDCQESFVFFLTKPLYSLQEKMTVFLSKNELNILKTPIYLFSDVWSIHELIGTNIRMWGTTSCKV